MESGAISDDQITASSEYSNNLSAIKSRLHIGKAWSAVSKDQHQWLQIDLGIEYTTNVTKVATQGRSAGNQWVKKYKLDYSHDGTNFHYYREPGQNTDKVVSSFPLITKLLEINRALRGNQAMGSQDPDACES